MKQDPDDLETARKILFPDADEELETLARDALTRSKNRRRTFT